MSSSFPRGHTAERFSVTGPASVQIGDRHYHAGPNSPASRFRNKHFEVPRNPSSAFTGREEICKQLQAHCLLSSKLNPRRQQKRFVIHGLGGSGKTQVCLKFAQDHREEFWGIFWLDASSAESLERSYLQIAEACGLEARMPVVKRWLADLPEPWALILDNADDPRLDISPYFPVGNRGVILITTRNPGCKVHSTVGSYELGAMTTEEAVTLLLKTAGIDELPNQSTRAAAELVVLTLGRLALAITHAGAVVRQGYCNIEEYPTLYSRRRQELLSQKVIQGREDYRYTVYTTWEVSRRMIEEIPSEAGQDALELLQIFSFFHYEGIPEEIFYRAWRDLHDFEQSDWINLHQPKMLLRQSDQEWSVYPLRAAISMLRSFSLIHYDKNSLISIHPLVHSWIRDRMSAFDEDMIWRQTTTIISLSIPWTFETTDYRFRQSIMPHIDSCLDAREDGIFSLQNIDDDCWTMASNFALVYSEAGRCLEELQLRERVVELRKRTLGEEHPKTLDSMHDLAISYGKAGRRQEVLELIERVVRGCKRTLGEEHPNTLDSLNILAISYRKAGRRQEALELTERVVEARQRTLGEEHPHTLASIHALGVSYSEAGRRQEALELTERVVEAMKRTLGAEHPDTLSSIYALSICYSEAGRRQEELELIERVVEARKRTLGEEHPHTVAAAHTLKDLKEGPQNKSISHRQSSNSENKSRIQHPENRSMKQHGSFIRFWKRLT
ncbi:MAG: hypothetical protein Q9172_003935 [Xanthocarpia lactea]